MSASSEAAANSSSAFAQGSVTTISNEDEWKQIQSQLASLKISKEDATKILKEKKEEKIKAEKKKEEESKNTNNKESILITTKSTNNIKLEDTPEQVK